MDAAQFASKAKIVPNLRTYLLFLLNNTLIPSWRVAFNPRRKLVIKSMKPIFRAKNSIADWGRTWIVLWWLDFLSNIGIPNVKWNNKKRTAKFILLCLIWSRELTDLKEKWFFVNVILYYTLVPRGHDTDQIICSTVD